MDDDDAQAAHDPLVYSNHLIGTRRLTWREVSERNDEEVSVLRGYHSFVSDLDRCEHGRHSVDACYGCAGISKGNPLLDRGDDGVHELVLGYGIGGLSEYVLRRSKERFGDSVVLRRVATGEIVPLGER